MKTNFGFGIGHIAQSMLILMIILCSGIGSNAAERSVSIPDSLNYVQYKGYVLETETRKALGFATLTLEGANLSTVANSEGEFIFNVPVVNQNGNVIVSYLGHKDKIIKLSTLKRDKNRIELELSSLTLSTVSVHPRDPDMLMESILNRRAENYNQDQNKMTVFYRETIKNKQISCIF